MHSHVSFVFLLFFSTIYSHGKQRGRWQKWGEDWVLEMEGVLEVERYSVPLLDSPRIPMCPLEFSPTPPWWDATKNAKKIP